MCTCNLHYLVPEARDWITLLIPELLIKFLSFQNADLRLLWADAPLLYKALWASLAIAVEFKKQASAILAEQVACLFKFNNSNMSKLASRQVNYSFAAFLASPPAGQRDIDAVKQISTWHSHQVNCSIFSIACSKMVDALQRKRSMALNLAVEALFRAGTGAVKVRHSRLDIATYKSGTAFLTCCLSMTAL